MSGSAPGTHEKRKKMRVLLVEDEKIIALFYKKILTVSGVEVRLAHTGEDALAQVDSDPDLDLLVLDINLEGGLDGIETCRRIHRKHSIPVLYVTAYSDTETRERAARTSPCGYLVKPVDAAELREAVLSRHPGCRRDH